MTLVVPHAPELLRLEIERLWNGAAAPDPRRRGRVDLSAWESGLRVEARLEGPGPSRVPDAPVGTRVADLWHYDVLECFLAGAEGDYVEVELGAGGHFLVLSFEGPRQLRDAREQLALEVDHERDSQGWRTAITLPWRCVPEPLCALDAFAIIGETHLAFSPMPGIEPDFHQPDAYPRARLAGRRS